MTGSKKSFFLDASEIQELAPGHGGCIATDKITVEGLPVSFMYREAPGFDADSGWRFFSGEESDDYLKDANNSGVYNVNTIANYDQSIIPYLAAPIGSVFEKLPGGKDFAPVEDWELDED